MLVQTLCLRKNVPYNIFHKWYNDTPKRIVRFQMDGTPPEPVSDTVSSVYTGRKNSSSYQVVNNTAIVSVPGVFDTSFIRCGTDICGTSTEQRLSYYSKRLGLSGFTLAGRETGGPMFSISSLNRFYYIRNFTDVRCKHARILSVIH